MVTVLGVTSLLLVVYVLLIWFWRHPMLLPDKGHYLYEVANENAAAAAVEILELHGIKMWKRKRIGPSNQVWMSDGMVLHWLTPLSAMDDWPVTSRSLVSSWPEGSAHKALEILSKYGIWDGQQTEVPGVIKPKSLMLVKSDRAFGGWCFAFRLWGPRMGMPPDGPALPFRKEGEL